MTVDARSHHAALEQLNEADAAAWLRCARAGDFDAAWRLSDRILARGRLRDHTAPRHHQQIWDGTPLQGRRVLVRCYHGLGDTLQFIRFAPLVRAVAREVTVWAQPALVDLLRGSPGIDRLLELHEGTPDVVFDVDVEIMELPHVFRTTLATIPAVVPYISAPTSALTGARPRVGITWRAGGWDERRSIPFAQVTRLLDAVPGASWFALQHEPRPTERHEHLQPLDTRGITPTASLMQGLDLVITIDSLPAHLAGALGRPVWALLPCDADWRWMAGRQDSPWYPTMRLFRQREPGAWDEVIDAVVEALQGGCHDHGS